VIQSVIKLFCLVLLGWLVIVAPAQAEFCRQVEGHRICILSIKRSAKNYWQYQATVSTDGIERPAASYDCREKSIVEADGNMALFRSRLDGSIVCSLYRR
jgi:hypothetical protein